MSDTNKQNSGLDLTLAVQQAADAIAEEQTVLGNNATLSLCIDMLAEVAELIEEYKQQQSKSPEEPK